MLKTVLVDDEQPALNELKFLLNRLGDIEIVGSYSNPLTALKNLQDDKPDLVFLDIDMPEIRGISLAQEILGINKNISVVFVTAYNDYAVKAFEINAVDYILKPVSFDRLKLCVNRLRERHGSNISGELLNNIDNSACLKSQFDKVVIWEDDEISLYNADEVLYFAAEQGNTIIVTNDGKHRTKESLESWENKLKNRGFFRCHRSFIVNVNRIKK